MLIMIAIILTVLMLLVVYFDATSFIIPNWLNGTVLALWPVFLLATPVEIEWWWSLAVFAAFFAVGMVIFSLNIIGGGDVKLLIAISPWLGWYPEILAKFGFIVAISGGILAIFLLGARFAAISIGAQMKKPPELPKLFRMKEPMPYGLAIAYAFAYLIWTNQIYGLIVS